MQQFFCASERKSIFLFVIFPQLGSCKYRCFYMNQVVGPSVFSTFTLQGLFSFFSFLFFCAHKNTQNAYKRTKIKNALIKHLWEKKSPIRFFAFSCFCLVASLCFQYFQCINGPSNKLVFVRICGSTFIGLEGPLYFYCSVICVLFFYLVVSLCFQCFLCFLLLFFVLFRPFLCV